MIYNTVYVTILKTFIEVIKASILSNHKFSLCKRDISLHILSFLNLCKIYNTLRRDLIFQINIELFLITSITLFKSQCSLKYYKTTFILLTAQHCMVSFLSFLGYIILIAIYALFLNIHISNFFNLFLVDWRRLELLLRLLLPPVIRRPSFWKTYPRSRAASFLSSQARITWWILHRWKK